MRVLYVVIAVVIVALLGVVAWLVFVPGASDFLAEKQEITDSEQINEMALAYVAIPYPDDYDALRVPGYVDNLSEQKFSEVVLEVQLLTDEGDEAEFIEHTVREIEPGARRSFDINAGTIADSRNAEVRIVKVVVVE